jgi:glutamate synthase domain-containing protein 3
MQYKQVQIKEDLISSIEIMKGNIIYILENEENAFEYLNENTSEILNISDLKNITLKISDKKFEEENITFKITGTYKDTKYEDYIVVDVEIVSPNIVNINYLED